MTTTTDTDDDFNMALNLVAESVNHFECGKHDREIAKAALRAAIIYAKMRRKGFVLASTTLG